MITVLSLIAVALIVWCFAMCINRQPRYFVAKIGDFWYICYEDLTHIDEVYRVAKFNTEFEAKKELENYER